MKTERKKSAFLNDGVSLCFIVRENAECKGFWNENSQDFGNVKELWCEKELSNRFCCTDLLPPRCNPPVYIWTWSSPSSRFYDWNSLSSLQRLKVTFLLSSLSLSFISLPESHRLRWGHMTWSRQCGRPTGRPRSSPSNPNNQSQHCVCVCACVYWLLICVVFSRPSCYL